MTTVAHGSRSLWQLALLRLLVAIFLLWLGTLAPADWQPAPVALPIYQFVAVGYLVFAVLLLLLFAHRSFRSQREPIEFQSVVGALGDTLGLCLALLAAGGTSSGLGLLLIPMVAASASVSPSRYSVFLAAVATLALLATELVIGPQMPWPFSPQPTQVGLLGATLLGAVTLASRLALRAGASEARVARQQEDLAKLAELNQQIIATMNTGVVAVDNAGQVLSINAAASRLFAADPVTALSRLPPALLKTFREWLAGSGRTTVLRVPGAGPQRELEVRITPLGIAGRQGALLMAEDAAETRRRIHASKLQALGRLTAGIAHEIRNPLGAISHSAQLLAESTTLNEDDRRLIEIVQDQSHRVDELIRNVLSLSRNREAARERFRLWDWLQSFAVDYCRTLQVPLDRIRVEVSHSELEVFFDSSQLRQILWNLCNNAWQHAGHRHPDSAPLRLRGYAEPAAQNVLLDVLDAGSGIPAGGEESLFEPFSSTSPTGTGLGLYISRMLCENNGATLDYVAQPDGSCFRIAFEPMNAMPEPDGTEKAGDLGGSDGHQAGAGRR